MKRKSRLVSFAILCLGLTLTFLPLEAVQAQGKVVELKIANFFPPPATHSIRFERFAKDLEMRSGGRFKVQYFPGGSLLKGPSMFDGIKSGLADIGYSHVYYTPGRFPVSEMFGLPLGIPCHWVGVHAWNDFVYKFKPKEGFEKIKVLWYAGSGPTVLLTKGKQVKKMEDFKGLIIRAPGQLGEMVRALGGTAAPTPMAEVYDAMSKGVINGGVISYEVLKSWRMHEVTDYTTSFWQVSNGYVWYVGMNLDKYNSLPPDLRSILDQLAGEYKQNEALMWTGAELEAFLFCKKKGIIDYAMPDEEMERWKKAFVPVIDEYIKIPPTISLKAICKYVFDKNSFIFIRLYLLDNLNPSTL